MGLKNRIRRFAIQGGLEAVALTRAWNAWPAAGGRGVVFTLHHVRPADTRACNPNALLSVTPQFLDEAIRAALERGLVPVALEDLPTLLADPSDKRRFVSFTLDDGYRDNADHAAPVFRRHRVPYTIFITNQFMDYQFTPFCGVDVAKGEIELMGDGQFNLSHVHTDDIAKLLVRSLKHPKSANGAKVKLATGRATHNELLALLEKVRDLSFYSVGFFVVWGRPLSRSK